MVIYTDGHCEGPNGVGGMFANSGYTEIMVSKALGTMATEDITKIHYKKKGLTNNEAELLAIAHALFLANKGDVIKSDSEFAVGLSAKNWKTKHERFHLLICFIRSLIKMSEVRVEWIKREDNPVT